MAISRALDFLSAHPAGRAVRRRLSAGKQLLKAWTRRVSGQPPAPAPEPVEGDAALARVQGVWNQSGSEQFLRDRRRASWSHIAQVHANHNFLTTGRPDYYWMCYLNDRYFPNRFAGDTLSLGCGEGHVDRRFYETGLRFRSFTGIDVAPGAIQKAQQLADAIPLSPRTHYFAADLNRYELPRASYDFIYFFQALHHIEALETMLRRVALALRPGGLLLVNEFVGPSRFQWTPTQVAMINTLLGILPEELRVDVTAPRRTIKSRCDTPTVEEMIALDPSEAVRSGEIDRVLKEQFEVLEEKPWGGTLHHMFFHRIAGNFDPENPYHRSIVELLIHHENTLLHHGILPSDFKLYVAKPRNIKPEQLPVSPLPLGERGRG